MFYDQLFSSWNWAGGITNERVDPEKDTNLEGIADRRSDVTQS